MFQYFSGTKEERITEQVALPKTNKSRYQWLSIAASVIVVFGLYFGNRYQVQKEQEQQEALYAYEQTKKALGLLAENFSKGTEKVAYLNEFEETKQKIYNHH